MPATERSPRRPTDDWQQVRLLVTSAEQATYELLRPLVLFGQPVRARARETGVPERTVRRKAARFVATGMRSLFAPDEPPAPDRRTLPLGIRKALRRFSKTRNLPWIVHNLDAIEGLLDRLHKGAHPGSFTMVQASSETPGHLQLGAKLDPELLGDCLSLGTAAMALLLSEIECLFPDSSTWQDEFKTIQQERNEWFREKYGEDSSVDVFDAPTPADAPAETS